MGFGIWVLGFGFWVLGERTKILRKDPGLGFRVHSSLEFTYVPNPLKGEVAFVLVSQR